jgi:hypothetical protein
MHALIEQVGQSNQPLPLAANGESTMANILQRTRITPIRFALLALGAISLSSLTLPAMAGDDAPDGGATNPSTCRDLVNHSCLTKPRDDQSSNNQDTKNSNYSRELSIILNRDDEQSTRNPANPVAPVRDATAIEMENQISAYDRAVAARAAQAERNWQNARRQGNTAGSGGNGGAAGHTGSRHSLVSPNRNAQTAAAPPKAATPKSTTTDKATNTMTRDYRTGATAAPGGPPPAAASGSSTKATAEQVAAQSGTRDHRH